MKKTGILILLMGLILSCGQPSSSTSSSNVANLETKVMALEAKLATIESDIATLRINIANANNEAAFVSTEEEGYSIAKTDLGAFAIVSKGATPYLDGYKVKLLIGNLTSATFNGFKLNIAWGKGKDRKNKEFGLTNRLYPGIYSKIEVALTPAKPEDIKMLSVGLNLHQIWMRQ
jgi:hypothetical protein